VKSTLFNPPGPKYLLLLKARYSHNTWTLHCDYTQSHYNNNISINTEEMDKAREMLMMNSINQHIIFYKHLLQIGMRQQDQFYNIKMYINDNRTQDMSNE